MRNRDDENSGIGLVDLFSGTIVGLMMILNINWRKLRVCEKFAQLRFQSENILEGTIPTGILEVGTHPMNCPELRFYKCFSTVSRRPSDEAQRKMAKEPKWKVC